MNNRSMHESFWKTMTKNIFFPIVLLIVCVLSANAQKTADVYIDKNGIMRWGDSKEEVHGFGVNYTAPFAHGYRSAKALHVDLEKAIDNDVYHFARLGFDAFRVHVWDTEISDSVGNLIDNEHLRLFDYMLMKMKERGIKVLLTPIAFWGNGYPDQDEKTPGFSFKYGKDACLVNEDAIKAQENYLFQFLNHVNSYTKVAYKNDPDIVAFEISNEPHHKGTPAEVTTFINRMVKSMRKTGCKKLIFYNISHSIHLSKAYFNSNIQGGTFQWYPTGLGAQHELRGNFLPNVDQYTIPFSSDPKFKSSAKVVYEFDAADIGRSYIYPAMARSFREAGIQWATHFAYDPTYMAFANTEYNTHYMNLAYAPQKALSLKLASEVFHHVPMYKNFGRYPANATFDAFHVSYENDLAEMVTDKKFIYTNNTTTQPKKPESLESISGFGNSSIVNYEGKGAYFLDKVEPGVWRLEVMPDAIWVDNIFGRNNLKKEVAVINWRTWPIKISLPDLGNQFNVTSLAGEFTDFKNSENAFQVRPGVYLLLKNGVTTKVTGKNKLGNIRLDEFTAPKTSVEKTYVLHTSSTEIVENNDLKIKASVITKEKPESVQLHINTPNGNQVIDMKYTSGYEYEVIVPKTEVQRGYITYSFRVKQNDVTQAFPSGLIGTITRWDSPDAKSYKIAVVSKNNSLYLFNAITDSDEVSKEWRRGANLLPGSEPNTALMVIKVPGLVTVDSENLNGTKIADYSLRYNFSRKINGRLDELEKFSKLIVKATLLNASPFPVQVALVMKNGNAFGGVITLDEAAASKNYAINISDLKPVKLVTLPRPYPSFLDYYFEGSSSNQSLKLSDVETLQISVGPGIGEANLKNDFSFALESIRME
jgi:hypothetical protein